MLTGKITCMGTNLKPGVQAYVNYTYADPTKVTAADIGAVNTAGDRTGMKLLQDTGTSLVLRKDPDCAGLLYAKLGRR